MKVCNKLMMRGDVTDLYAEGPMENVTNPFPTLHMENITDSQTNKSTTTRQESSPKCVEGANAVNPTRNRKLICFITLWALGVTAALFFGLTVFLWIRLSVQAKRRRRRTGGWGDEEMGGVELQEEKSLWLRPEGTVAERVEFWYANGSSGLEGGAGNQRRDSRRGNERRGEERPAGDLWVQPKVTLEEITEFWYTHGRTKQDDGSEQV
ncbi:hypothetical protein GJAV_G00217240 [Gymnothorax javanicus]|nr:hypothetical protein GJAV_G00217240 [Gymnothorax javanicus]